MSSSNFIHNNIKYYQAKTLNIYECFVLSPGIEPRPVAPQATVLSIKLQEHEFFRP